MAMAPPRLLRGLIAPLSLSPADCLPRHQQLLTSAVLLHRWWLPSLARLRCPSCSDGFKLFLVLILVSAALAEVRFVTSASMADGAHPPPRRPRRRRKSELHVPAAICGGHSLHQGAHGPAGCCIY